MLLPDKSESDFENGDDEKAELLRLTENDFDTDYSLNLDWSRFAFSIKTKKTIR